MNVKKLVAKMMDKMREQDAKPRPFAVRSYRRREFNPYAGCNKQFSTLRGIPVLAHTLMNLEACEYVVKLSWRQSRRKSARGKPARSMESRS